MCLTTPTTPSNGSNASTACSSSPCNSPTANDDVSACVTNIKQQAQLDCNINSIRQRKAEMSTLEAQNGALAKDLIDNLGYKEENAVYKEIKQAKKETPLQQRAQEETRNAEKGFKPKIRWLDLMAQLFLHLGAVYGLFLLFSAKFYTFLWVIFTIWISGIGITAGAHRLWSHKSYNASLPLRSLLIFLFTIAGQRDAYTWALDHRIHHKFSETDADPHNAKRGFFFAHVGWLFLTAHPKVEEKRKVIDMSDLENDGIVMFQRKWFIPLFALCSIAFPVFVPWYYWNECLWQSFWINFNMRFTCTLNIAFFVNSVAHMWGRKPYDKNISPVESPFVSFLALGEGWHNYHHVFPWDYKTGEFGNYTLNVTTAFIDFCARFGLAKGRNSRKRPPSFVPDGIIGDNYDEEEMNENNAAMILVTLSLSPKSPITGEKWLGSSPGSSSASWSSGSSSPPLSDDGHIMSVITNNDLASARLRTTSVSTSDEGIVVDFKEDVPRKKRPNKSKFVCTWKGCNISEHTKAKIERHIRLVHLGYKKLRRAADHLDSDSHDSDSHEEEFYYTEVEDDDDDCKTPSPTSPPTLSHRDMARPQLEDPEYQRQLVGNFKQGRAAAQLQQQKHNIQQINGKSKHHSSNNHQQHTIYMGSNSQQLPQLQSNTNCMPTSPLAHHNYAWPPAKATTVITSNTNQHVGTPSNYHHQHQPQQQPPTTFIKHARASPRPSQSTAPYPSPTYVHQHHNYSSPAPNSPKHTVTVGAATIVHHNNSGANSVLQQLSQQNITVTTTNHSNSPQNQHHNHQTQQQLQNLATVTITPNYTQTRGVAHHQETSTQQHHQLHQQQQQTRLQQSPTTATASHRIAVPNTNSNNCNSGTNLGSPTTATTATTTAANAAHHIHQQHVTVQHANKQTPNSPNRRTRGENKKCRKVYGMDRRDMWCTQCRWKKACSRFGD